MYLKTLSAACFALCALTAHAKDYTLSVTAGDEASYQLFNNKLVTPGNFSDTFNFSLLTPAESSIYVLAQSGHSQLQHKLLGLDDISLSLVNRQTGQTWQGVIARTIAEGTAAYTGDLMALQWMGFDANQAQLISDVLPQGDYTATVTGSVQGLLGSTYIAEFKLQSVVASPSAVPEPGSYALMGLGLVGLSLVARRRQHAA